MRKSRHLFSALFGLAGQVDGFERKDPTVLTARRRYLTMICLLSAVVQAASANEQQIKFVTADGVSIAATVSVPDKDDAKHAAVIFVHQGGSSKEEWDSLPIFEQVTAQGFYALAYDVRGHGESGGEADFNTLFDDPNQAPQDLAAAIEWLRQTGRVDMSRIAVVGASIGANLACVAAGSTQLSIKTAVAISAKVTAVYNLAGGREHLKNLHSVFLIASELDQDGKRAAWARALFELAAEPRMLDVVAGSNGHGVAIFDDDPELQQRIVDWLVQTL